MLSNLIGNAIKYSSTRPISIIKMGTTLEGETTTYYITDNGVGFNQKYVDKIFGVFQRLHKGNEFEGTGVGMAIAQRVVHHHGGTIWAEGVVGQGASFYFTLGN